MADDQGYIEEPPVNPADKVKFKCNLCEYSNHDRGGMKRHILAKHKASNAAPTKRKTSTEIVGEEKRTKVDNDDSDFDPSTVSTQVAGDLNIEEAQEATNDATAEESDEFSNETLAAMLSTFDSGIRKDTSSDAPKESDIEDMVIVIEDKEIDSQAENILVKIKVSELEAALSNKTLELAELSRELEAFKGEASDLNEETAKLKQSVKDKEELNDLTIAKVNSLESSLKEKEGRNNLLEPLIAKFLSENKRLKKSLDESPTTSVSSIDANLPGSKLFDENVQLKTELKEAKLKIEAAKRDKGTLASELAKAQEKLNGENKETSDKCVKLSNELKTRCGELRVLERENKFLTENLASLQTTLNEKNNKISEVQTLNVRLENFNKKMYELCERKEVFKKLEATNAKEIESQNSTFVNNLEERNHNQVREESSINNTPTTNQKRCWFWENGMCKKGEECDRYHPKQICEQFKQYGNCPSGESCPNRHPVQVCRRFLNNRCTAGNLCVHQHPLTGVTGQGPAQSSAKSPARQSSDSFLVGSQSVYNRSDTSRTPSGSPHRMSATAPPFLSQTPALAHTQVTSQPQQNLLMYPHLPQPYPQTSSAIRMSTPLFIHPNIQQVPVTSFNSLPYPPNPQPLPVQPFQHAQPPQVQVHQQPHQAAVHRGPPQVWGIQQFNQN